MSKNEIIGELTKGKVIEEIISNISKGRFPYTEDLAQDLYLKLLEKEEEKIVQLYKDNQLKFFIVKMVSTNLFSPRSDYYYDYKKWEDKKNELSTINENELNNHINEYQ